MLPVVGVNLLWLVPGVVGGSEEYTLRLLRAVDRLDPNDLWFRLYVQPSLLEAHPDLQERFEVMVTPRALGSKAARIATEHSWLAHVSRHDQLMHHAGGVVPFVSGVPSVLTIHDLQPLDMPQHFGVVKRSWLRATLPRSARVARRVLCPSTFSANRVAQLLDVAPNRLRVVPHGHERTTPGVLDPATDEALRERFGRFLLLPAIAYAHKRHADLIDALALLADRFGDLSVVMTSSVGPETSDVLAKAEALGLHERCHYLGRVDEADLDALYRSAAAMVFPSVYEGFGNPTLEAMARGCPVVATTAASIPEVVGDAGLLVEPAQPRALAAAVARVLAEPGLADTLAEAGVEQAKKFGWREAGQHLLGAYREALA